MAMPKPKVTVSRSRVVIARSAGTVQSSEPLARQAVSHLDLVLPGGA